MLERHDWHTFIYVHKKRVACQSRRYKNLFHALFDVVSVYIRMTERPAMYTQYELILLY